MSPARTDLERARDNKLPTLMSLHTAVWQNAIETRAVKEALTDLTNKIDRYSEAIVRFLEAQERAR